MLQNLLLLSFLFLASLTYFFFPSMFCSTFYLLSSLFFPYFSAKGGTKALTECEERSTESHPQFNTVISRLWLFPVIGFDWSEDL